MRHRPSEEKRLKFESNSVHVSEFDVIELVNNISESFITQEIIPYSNVNNFVPLEILKKISICIRLFYSIHYEQTMLIFLLINHATLIFYK